MVYSHLHLEAICGQFAIRDGHDSSIIDQVIYLIASFFKIFYHTFREIFYTFLTGKIKLIGVNLGIGVLQ